MGGAYLKHNDANVFYTVEGSGDPVLLIHGWACDQNDWVFQIPFLLAHGFRVIALDLRGHGRSSVEPSATLDNHSPFQLDPETMADDAAALLVHLGLGSDSSNGKPAIVMGHSLGGVVASELAFRHPKLVRALILVDAAYYMTVPLMEHIIGALKKSPEAAPETATAILQQGEVYTAETPAWLKAWHARRTWGMPAPIVTAAFEQLAAFLGRWETGAAYAKERKGLSRLATCAGQQNADVEKEVGVDGDLDRVEVIAAGHWHHIVGADLFNSVVEGWLRERGYL
ncbi:uncharacterized protein ALTATR162_LOCUS11691 [Neofusicoccum parvum]|uniref:Uncharacterized protein ALTATR162_LOCUS11691 n=1 Tax=Neofusicoccum parvum TaxID=310453 RepID=A0ACB5RST9_9PEZI|nr:uncharacterized protein ALTATR162_LOCUS11691 [Neofusicoccum parvum]GME56419.1 uncharacterized protein ALTATR162_LOCUS11691 [Neofusicoccum parvum]